MRQLMKSINTASDNNTQAMTEVALGLSMAFFSLLILALLSMTGEQISDLATTEQSQNTEAMQAQNRLSLAEQASKTTQQELSSSPVVQEQISFIFYYEGSYYDTALVEHSPSNVDPDKTTVVAVLPNLSFAEVMQVHKDFAHKAVQITAMDQNWEQAFKTKSYSQQTK